MFPIIRRVRCRWAAAPSLTKDAVAVSPSAARSPNTATIGSLQAKAEEGCRQERQGEKVQILTGCGHWLSELCSGVFLRAYSGEHLIGLPAVASLLA